jgi:glucose-1-phosphate cytidylyltransferase
MKTVIFAGGYGTRLMEETETRPKPMVEIGGRPILWHIMKLYSHYGYNDFIICLGYKGYIIKEYFINYFMHNADITIDLNSNQVKIHESNSEKFKITLIDTGLNTKTAGRLKRIQHHIDDETFLLTYGDGVSNIDLKELVSHHNKSKRIGTITSVQPAGRFGSLEIDKNEKVLSFVEKPKGDGYWINGGFFVLNKEVFNYLPDNADEIMWEEEPLNNMAKDGQLNSYKHDGFWKCMDHLRDKRELEELWKSGKAPWKVW